MAPDRRSVAFIRMVKSDDTPDYRAGALWIKDCRTGKVQQILPASFNGGTADSTWISLSHPVFSPDARNLYVNAAFGGDDMLIQRIDWQSRRRTYLMSGQLYGVVRHGPLQGDLIVSQHTLLKDKSGNEYGGYPYYIYAPDGSFVRNIPGSENWSKQTLRNWLHRQNIR